MKTRIYVLAVGVALASAPAAQAASADYLLEIDGIKGEVTSAPLDSWSFGVCNAGQCAGSAARQTIVSPRDPASGQATGKRTGVTKITASQNSQSLRESPTLQSKGKGQAAAGGVRVAAGDVDGDGSADFAYAGTQDAVADLTLVFDKASPVLARVCEGKHIAKATLRSPSDSFEISDAHAACTASGDATQVVLSGGQMKHTKTGHVTLLK